MVLDKTLSTISSAIFLVISVAFFCLFVGGRFLTLSPDESWFLHLAYAFKNTWITIEGTESRSYDLYVQWLSLLLDKDLPQSLWRAVIIDSAMQVIAMLSIVIVGTSLLPKMRLLSVVAIVAGVLFFFTIGRLAEHRPDYLSIWALSIAGLIFVRYAIAKQTKTRNFAIFLAGALAALSVCFSPRAVTLLVFSSPLVMIYLIASIGFQKTFTIIATMSLGVIGSLVLVWLLTGFSFPDTILGLLEYSAGSGRSISLQLRLTHGTRIYQSLLILLALLICLFCFLTSTQKKTKLISYIGLAFAIGQLALIVYDKLIYGYGYSYALVSVVLAVIALTYVSDENRRRKNSRYSVGRVSGFFGGINLTQLGSGLSYLALMILFGIQLPKIAQANGYHYDYRVSVSSYYDRTDDVKKLIGGLYRDQGLLPSLTSRISLCQNYPNAEYITTFGHSPICLKSAYNSLSFSGKNIIGLRRLTYPENVDQVSKALHILGMSKDQSYNGAIIIKDSEGNTRQTVVF
jgi:hypothetical protein